MQQLLEQIESRGKMIISLGLRNQDTQRKIQAIEQFWQTSSGIEIYSRLRHSATRIRELQERNYQLRVRMSRLSHRMNSSKSFCFQGRNLHLLIERDNWFKIQRLADTLKRKIQYLDTVQKGNQAWKNSQARRSNSMDSQISQKDMGDLTENVYILLEQLRQMQSCM